VAAYNIDTRYGSSGAHSPVVYIKTGGRRGRFERLAPAGFKAAGTGDAGSASAGTPGALRVGVTEPGMEPGGDLVVGTGIGPPWRRATLLAQAARHPLAREGSTRGWKPNVADDYHIHSIGGLNTYLMRSTILPKNI
jgi:hypothetical protein